MRLGRKNLLYSMALAGVMMLFLIGYFIYMLPSLYVDYVMEQNLKSIYAQHMAYRETGSYEGVRVKNATACFSVEIPMDGDFFLVTGKVFSAEITVKDQRLIQILDSCRRKLEGDFDLSVEMEALGEILQESMAGASLLPVEISLLVDSEMEGYFFNESAKVHTYFGGLVILESSVEDANNRYANYIAIEQTENSLVLSFLPVVAPDAEEIRPVVLQSLPMLGAVILLLVLLFSRIYSKGIVGPILRLARHSEEMEHAQGFTVRPLSEEWPDRKDEIRELADTLDDFYRQIRESYHMLEEKNRELAEENRRQEVFLRASSHQLKTPIAAALLLVEGMMNEIGKYRETKVYLPKVKEQLLSMRKMVEDILYLNHCAESIGLQQVDIGRLLEGRLHSYQVELADKKIAVDITGEESLVLCTDEMMASQILDNLLSNAVKYTPQNGSIRIVMRAYNEVGKPEIRIENSGVTIPDELLLHIFEPFVSGSHEGNLSVDSHGLGLYIASYYAKKLDIALSVGNGEDSVISTLTFLL